MGDDRLLSARFKNKSIINNSVNNISEKKKQRQSISHYELKLVK